MRANGWAARGSFVLALLTLAAVAGLASASSSPAARAAPPAWLKAAAAELPQLPVHPLANPGKYVRSSFGPAWPDLDGDGCDTRQEILHRDLKNDVPATGCPVRRGTLDDPYSDGPRIAYDSKHWEQVQIDHVVSLKNAWRTGAAGKGWTLEWRTTYANDPLVLLAVARSPNEQKGEHDASEWLPPESYRCRFVAKQIAIKFKYHLWVTRGEHDAMANVLAACTGE